MGARGGVAEDGDAPAVRQAVEGLDGAVGGDGLALAVALVLPYLRAAQRVHLLRHCDGNAGAGGDALNDGNQVVLAQCRAAEDAGDAGGEVEVVGIGGLGEMQACWHGEELAPVRHLSVYAVCEVRGPDEGIGRDDFLRGHGGAQESADAFFYAAEVPCRGGEGAVEKPRVGALADGVGDVGGGDVDGAGDLTEAV